MKPSKSHSGEIQVIGKRTREWIVNARACPALRLHGIDRVGISEAAGDFRFLRTMPEMSVLMAATAGRGRALIDGQYRSFPAGVAYLMPWRIRHGYEAAGRGTWRVCWVCHLPHGSRPPVIAAEEPRLVPADAAPLEEAIRGLYRETMGRANASVQKLYAQLIQEHALRIGRNSQVDDRLTRLWTIVEADLPRPWTLGLLAREVGMSIESLRLLCHQCLGCSPMKHLAMLRVQAAATTLVSSEAKLADIAFQVGYSDSFAFSVVFKRCMGIPPRLYRAQRQAASIH